jgi:hypothetical protein
LEQNKEKIIARIFSPFLELKNGKRAGCKAEQPCSKNQIIYKISDLG